MGRRRRKVTRIPKKRLPKYFDCPKCGGSKTIAIIISKEKNAIATVICPKCGGSLTKNLARNQTDFFCPRCNLKIATISLVSNNVKVTCGSCGTTNLHQITGQETPFNCSCPPPQGRFLIRPAKRLAMIHCGKCGLKEYIEPRPNDEPVDIYGAFYDRYYGVHRPPPQLKKESYLDILKREVKRHPVPHPVESISTITNEQKEIFKRRAETEKKERKLRREG